MDNTPPEAGRVDRPVRTNRPFCVGDKEYSSVICSARIRTDLLRGSAGRGLAENHLRPAGQPGGHRAKIIAAGQRNTRQLSGQRLFDLRLALDSSQTTPDVIYLTGGSARSPLITSGVVWLLSSASRTCSIMRVRG